MGWLKRSPRIPSTWRHKLIPACPNCGRAAALGQHRDCKNWLAERRGKADLYLDIATGQGHCIACGVVTPIEKWTHWCHCGAVYEGGEVWQGMAAEAGRMGNLAWLKAAGIQRGTPQITMLGWSSCLACRGRFDQKTGFVLTGTRKGGLCETCHERARKRLKPWLSLYRTRQPCSWCGYVWPRERIVRVGRARLCGRCSSQMWLWPW